MRAAALCFIVELACVAQQSHRRVVAAGGAPGGLRSSTTQTLAQAIAGKSLGSSLPASAGRAGVMVCLYRASEAREAPQVRRFWRGSAPAWIGSVGETSQLHDLVEGVTGACPASMAEADALQDSSDVRLAANKDLIATESVPEERPARGPVQAAASSPERVEVARGKAVIGAATGRASGAAAPGSFSAKGLNYEHELTALYLGDFAHSRLKSDTFEFNLLVSTYIGAFSTRCADALPANKVEIMESYCKVKRQMVNRYGAPVGPETCAESATRGTGRYADPELYATEGRLDARTGTAMVGDVFSSMRDKNANPMAGAMHMTDTVAGVGRDMDGLLQRNGCASGATKRFQQNLLLFANDQPPAVMAGGATLASLQTARGAASGRDADYAKLMEDLVVDQSRTWMMNSYQAGSITNLDVSKGSDGRASVLRAGYGYLRMGESVRCSVRVVFEEGLPKCLYFSDFPDTCRAASKRVSTAYEDGEYGR